MREDPAATDLAVTPSEIVVPVGDGPAARRALAPAARLARALRLRIHLLTVVRGDIAPHAHVRLLEELDELRRAVERVYPEIRPVHTRLVDHVDLVDALADEYPSGLVVLGTDRAALGALEASVVTVIRGLPPTRSIVVVGPSVDPGWRPGPVVVTLDGSAVAEAALAPAVGWAELVGAPLVVLRVLPRVIGDHLEERDGSVEGATRYLRRIAEQLRATGLDARGLLLHADDPVTSIVDYLTHHECALAVMTTHARTGISRAALGSVALAVAATSPCPIRVVRTSPTTQLALPAG
jgi:nucleotide-binding universal stress UspA family protein